MDDVRRHDLEHERKPQLGRRLRRVVGAAHQPLGVDGNAGLLQQRLGSRFTQGAGGQNGRGGHVGRARRGVGLLVGGPGLPAAQHGHGFGQCVDVGQAAFHQEFARGCRHAAGQHDVQRRLAAGGRAVGALGHLPGEAGHVGRRGQHHQTEIHARVGEGELGRDGADVASGVGLAAADVDGVGALAFGVMLGQTGHGGLAEGAQADAGARQLVGRDGAAATRGGEHGHIAHATTRVAHHGPRQAQHVERIVHQHHVLTLADRLEGRKIARQAGGVRVGGATPVVGGSRLDHQPGLAGSARTARQLDKALWCLDALDIAADHLRAFVLDQEFDEIVQLQVGLVAHRHAV